MKTNRPLTAVDKQELFIKSLAIKNDYRSGKRSAKDCIAELMGAPFYYPSSSWAMRFLDPGPPQADPPRG